MKRVDRIYLTALLALSSLYASSLDAAQDRSPDELFPDTAVVYVEVPRAADTVDFLLEHPLTRQVLDMEAFKQALEDKEMRELRAVVGIVESRLDLTWREMLSQVVAGGLYLAVDRETEGVALLVKASDAETRHRVLEQIMDLARTDAKAKGKDDPYEKHEYRGITAYHVDQGIFAELGPWLLVTNKADLGKYIANAYLDGNGSGLGTATWFQQARACIHGTPAAWAGFDIATLRTAGVAKDLFRERTENIVAEIIMGGIHDTLRQAPLATASLDIDAEEVRLRLATPFEENWISESREYFFAGAAPPRLELSQHVLAVSTFRDLAYVWLHAPDLFEEKAVDETAKAESGLSNLFGGKDFGEDILGAFHPELQIVVSRQDFGERTPQPALKLPSFALVARLRDVETMQPELRRAFQSVLGFLNVVGATQGQPQLDMDMEKTETLQLITSAYLATPDNRQSRQARINYNFSPSVAFVGDRFILASTQELARELATAGPTKDGSSSEDAEDATANTAGHVNVALLQQILADNREHLISNNMLEKGNERNAAEIEVDTFLVLAKLIEEGSFSLRMSPGELELLCKVRLATM